MARERLLVADIVERIAPLFGLLILTVALSMLSKDFFTAVNLSSLARQMAAVAVAAIGMTFVIITAGIDLSVGSMMAFGGICASKLIVALMDGIEESAEPTLSVIWLEPVIVFAGSVAAVLAGALCGLVNGLLITALRLPPFIVTLGMLGIVRGVTLCATQGLPVVNLPESFGLLAEATLLGVPSLAVVVFGVALLAGIVLSRTRLGRYLYVIGSNEEAARLSGVRVVRCKIIAYGVCGALAGLGGLILASRLSTGQPTAASGYELDVIAAVVTGGGSLMGGEGTVLGTIVGAFIMGVLRNGCTLLDISDFVQMIVIGAVIILTVAIDKFRRWRETV